MSTNYYLSGRRGNWNPEFHIGKRSAAGFYCWDCGLTLCKGGESHIHLGVCQFQDKRWHKECPCCGQRPDQESLENSTSGRELGFNHTNPQRKTGVATCSSFSWAMPRKKLEEWCKHKKFILVKPIIDEYGRKFSWKEFLEILSECPIQYTESIGKEFS